MAFERFFTDISQTANSESFVNTKELFGDPTGSVSAEPGFQNLQSLSAEAGQLVTYVRRKLGEPILTVELDNSQIFTCFEESNIEYSAKVNHQYIRNHLAQIVGQDKGMDTNNMTNKLPYGNMELTKRIARAYEEEIGLAGRYKLRRGYINLTNAQNYDIYNTMIDEDTNQPLSASCTAADTSYVHIVNVWHHQPVSLYRFFDPYSSVNILSQEFSFESFTTETSFYVLPIWNDVLRGQMLDLNDRVRRSNYGYDIVGRNFRIFPQPGGGIRLYFDYYLNNNPFLAEGLSDAEQKTVEGISNFSNVPLNNIAYEVINSTGKRWMRKYTLALAMELLGQVRSKFSSIPIPGADVILNGSELVRDGKSKQDELIAELEKTMDTLLNVNLMKDQAEIAEQIWRQYKGVPLGLWRLA